MGLAVLPHRRGVLDSRAGATWRDDDEAEGSEGLVLEEATRVGRGLPAIEDEE